MIPVEFLNSIQDSCEVILGQFVAFILLHFTQKGWNSLISFSVNKDEVFQSDVFFIENFMVDIWQIQEFQN